jgi:hypothetical protein
LGYIPSHIYGQTPYIIKKIFQVIFEIKCLGHGYGPKEYVFGVRSLR